MGVDCSLLECTAAYSALAASRIAIGLALPSFPLSIYDVSDFDETWCEQSLYILIHKPGSRQVAILAV